MEVTKPYDFIGFGAMEVTKPHDFIGFGAMEVTKPYKFIGFGGISATTVPCLEYGLCGPARDAARLELDTFSGALGGTRLV